MDLHAAWSVFSRRLRTQSETTLWLRNGLEELTDLWWNRLMRWMRFSYLKILRQRSSPHSIALGAGIGMFVGFLPIIPFQMLVALFAAFVCRASKISAVAFTSVSNPINIIPFYALLYWVGKHFLPMQGVHWSAQHLRLTDLLAQGWQMLLAMVLGGVLLGAPAAVLTYLVVRWAVIRYRRGKMLRLLKKRTGV